MAKSSCLLYTYIRNTIATTFGGTMLEIKYKPKPEKTENEQPEDVNREQVSLENLDKEVEPISGDEVAETAEYMKKHSGKAGKIILGFFVLILTVFLTFGFSLWREYSRKDSQNGKEIEVTIEQGSSTREVCTVLKESGVIRYELPFLVKMYFSEYKGKLRYGTFQLNDGMSLDTIVKELATGGALKEEQSFTIPEGYSVKMIAEKLEKEKIMSADEFLAAVEKAAQGFAYEQELPAKDQVFYQMEGYLFPDTYYLSENMTGDELVAKILEEFNQKFDQ